MESLVIEVTDQVSADLQLIADVSPFTVEFLLDQMVLNYIEEHFDDAQKIFETRDLARLEEEAQKQIEPEPGNPFKDLLSVKEAAKYIGYSVSHLSNLRKQGLGPKALQFGKSSFRYRKSDLDQWFEDLVNAK